MVKRLGLTPVLCTAIGAAVSFYLWDFLLKNAIVLFILMIVLTVSLCLFRVLASMNPGSRTLRLAAIYSAVFTAGVCIGAGAAGTPDSVNFGIPAERVKAVTGELLEDPRIISGGRTIASLSLKESAGSGGLRVSARGALTVFFPEDAAIRLREFGRGSAVFAEGSLRGGSDTGGFLFFAKSLHIVKPAPALEQFRTGVRMSLIQKFDNAALHGSAVSGSHSENSSWGGLALALLVGVRDSLDLSLAEQYRDAGCSYILALSGMHLAIIAALMALLLKKPLGLKPAALTSAFIIVFYCFIVGPMPSLNRAALMYLLGVFAVLNTLPKKPLQLLGMSFIIQIIVSPDSGHSVSFMLSYLALLGILLAGEAINKLFAGKIPPFLLQPLSASVGAFLATAGITAFFFGVLRPIGIITGLVLIPLTTAFMIGAIGWLVLSLFSPALSGLLAIPLSLLYRVMEKLVFFASRAPGINSSRPMIILVLSLGLSLLLMLPEYRRKNSCLPFG
jgi:competence protein ComEC